jgi:hypothetical protein
MEEVFDSFIRGHTGNRSDDYYYTYNSKGSKYFYSKITGKRVAKNDIPAKFHNLIKEKDPGINIGELQNLRNVYLLEIEKLNAKIKEINVKLLGVDGDEEIKKYKKQQEEDELRRQEYKREREEALRNLFKRFNNDNSSVEKDILQELNIHTKREWKDWLVKNHPDRQGDVELCKKVITAGRNRGW